MNPSLRWCEEQAGSHASTSRRPVRAYEARSAPGREAEDGSRCFDTGKYFKLKSVDTGEPAWRPEVS